MKRTVETTDKELLDSGLLVLEGTFLVERGVQAGLAIQELTCVPAKEEWARSLVLSEVCIRVLSEAEMATEAGYPFHRGVRAIAQRPRERPLPDFFEQAAVGSGVAIALPELVDPANLGAIFRSAAALGASALFLGPEGPDPFCRRALRSSMGAVLSLPWYRLQSESELQLFKQHRYQVAATVLDSAAQNLDLYQAPERLLLLLGNEAFGLSDAWKNQADTWLTIPLAGGTDSLNVAAAAAIFLYELRKKHPHFPQYWKTLQ